MSCRCGCGGLPKPEFMERLERIREEVKFPMIISSGYRCPEYNARVSDTGRTGPHTLGLAADVQVYGERALKLLEVAILLGMTGIGVSQKGKHSDRFLHLDCVRGKDAPRPWIWSY